MVETNARNMVEEMDIDSCFESINERINYLVNDRIPTLADAERESENVLSMCIDDIDDEMTDLLRDIHYLINRTSQDDNTRTKYNRNKYNRKVCDILNGFENAVSLFGKYKEI